MLNEELIDLVNSGQAWGLVGSGASCMAGVPSWSQLVLSVKERCLASATTASFDEPRFTKALKTGIPQAFLYLEEVFGRPAIEETVAVIVAGFKNPGEMHTTIATWPLAGYATFNFDTLLEAALLEADRASWTPVGNTASENRLISHDADHVVWHPHGVCALPHKNQRLVLTSNDYDEFYASGSSTLDALDSLLRMKRIVIFGFGFSDDDILSVLKHIRRVTTPGKPAFAFLPNCTNRKRSQFRSDYNVEVISYSSRDGDHSHAVAILKIYTSFIIPREVQYAVPTAIHPEFDEQVTSLITHNRLVSHGVQVSKDASQALLTASVLRQFAAGSQLAEDDLKARLPVCGAGTIALLPQVIEALVSGGVLESVGNGFHLTQTGTELLQDASSNAELLHEQFFQHIRQRCKNSVPTDAVVDTDRVAAHAAEYFRMLGKKCGLAVAQQLTRADPQQSRARQAAILQSLHNYIRRCRDSKEAAWLVKLVLQILEGPSQQEQVYLGYLSQAYFGQHLLNADFNASRLQIEHLRRTVFLFDASFVIRLLAPSARGHALAVKLYQRLQELHCPLVTTDTLLEEVAEHAQYAWRVLREHGSLSSRIVEMARRGTAHANVFLESYLVDSGYGPNSHYQRYFDDTTHASGAAPHSMSLKPFIESLSIRVMTFSQWGGFTKQHLPQRDFQIDEIRGRRVANGTYKHDRQVRAEAEVAVIISQLRNGDFQWDGEPYQDAFFVAHSRVLDGLPGMPPWISMKPEPLLNWLVSVREISREDASALFDQILHELSHNGIEVLPRSELVRVFSGVIDGSKERVVELKRDSRELVKARYGAAPELAFKDVDPLAWPIIEYQLKQDLVEKYESKLARERLAKMRLEEELRKSKRNDKEFLRLKSREEARKQKSKQRARRDASKPKKKRKRKK